MSNTKNLIIPSKLTKGDKIAIVSTARKISLQELQPAIQIIEEKGFEVVIGESIGAEENQFAGNDKHRASDLQQMLDNDEIKAILCARGGYGTVRLIDQLDFSHFSQRPKWIIGYSDVTALHAHVHSNYRICTLHASMPLNFEKNTNEALKSIFQAISGQAMEYNWSPNKMNVCGEANGLLVGGNLSVLYSISSSISDLDTKGKILFLEDLDEYLYHIDRMMMQMKRSGKLHHLSGVVVGGLNDMHDNEIPFGKTAEKIISDHLPGVPVTFGFPAGHVDDNRALIFGNHVTLSISETSCNLKFN